MLSACAREAMAHERQLVTQADVDLPAKLSSGDRAMTVTRLTDAELHAFKTAAVGLRSYFEKTVGGELLAMFEASAREAESAP